MYANDCRAELWEKALTKVMVTNLIDALVVVTILRTLIPGILYKARSPTL